jgi:hypothetical protein
MNRDLPPPIMEPLEDDFDDELEQHIRQYISNQENIDEYVTYFMENADNIAQAVIALNVNEPNDCINDMVLLFEKYGYPQQPQQPQQEWEQPQEWEQEPELDDEVSPELLREILRQEFTYRSNIRKAYEICDVDDATRIAYYNFMLPEWTIMTVFDIMEQQDVDIKTYITEDPDNIVFVVAGHGDAPKRVFTSTRDQVNKVLAVYECEGENSMNRVFLPLNHIGAPFGAVADYDMTKIVVTESNYQIFFIRPLPEETCHVSEMQPQSDRLVSHEVKYLKHSFVNDAHCQDGTQRAIYQIHVPSFYK